jgi:hypothetical protein
VTKNLHHAGLLALPAVLRRRRGHPAAAPLVGSYQPTGAAPVLMTSAGSAAPPAQPAAPVAAEIRRCTACDTPLRPAARFCSRCGAAQGERP